MRRHVAATLALALSTASLAAPAFADSASDQAAAEALFVEGRRLVGEGRFAEACPKFAESHRLDPAPGTLVNLGGCYEKNGQTASAWATFKLAASLAAQKGRADYEATARQHVASLEPLLSTLTIVVPKEIVVDGLVVKRDGVAVGAAEWGVAIPVDPGAHTVEATAPKKKRWSSTAKVEGNAAKIELRVVALGNDAKSAATVSTTLFGIGLGAVAVGAVLYLTAPSGAAAPSSVAVRVAPGPGSMTMTVGATW